MADRQARPRWIGLGLGEIGREKSRMDAAEKDVTNRIRDVGHATAVEVANGRRARQMLQDVRPASVQLSSSVCLSPLLLRFPKFHSFLFQVLDDGWILDKMRGGGGVEESAALLEKFHRDIMLLIAPSKSKVGSSCLMA